MRIARKIPASNPSCAIRKKHAGYDKSISVAKVANGEGGVLDAEAYVEGNANDWSETCDAAPHFMESGWETFHVGKTGNCRNRFKSSRSGVICLGG